MYKINYKKESFPIVVDNVNFFACEELTAYEAAKNKLLEDFDYYERYSNPSIEEIEEYSITNYSEYTYEEMQKIIKEDEDDEAIDILLESKIISFDD